MPLDFGQASAIRASAPGTYEAVVPDGWQQGGGLWSGDVCVAMNQQTFSVRR